MKVLSIQSSVAFGHAGNSSAVFPLQRLGIEVWPVHTVHFSNHTGHGSWRGPVLDPGDVAEVITGIEERGVFATCDAVLSGYQGAEAVGAVILDAVARVKAANPAAIYCCDPVMGDVGRGFFVRDGIPEFMRDKVIPAADVATPNQFELEFLTGRAIDSAQSLLDAADALRAMGPRTVLVTSVLTDTTALDRISMVVVDDTGAWEASTELLPLSVNGAGDLTTALFLAHLSQGAAVALARTAASVYGVLEATHRSGEKEIRIVDAQEQIAHPAQIDVTRLR